MAEYTIFRRTRTATGKASRSISFPLYDGSNKLVSVHASESAARKAVSRRHISGIHDVYVYFSDWSDY